MEIILLIIIITMLVNITLNNGSKSLNFSKHSEKELLIDTSILIDGRFSAAAKTGFITYKILIPRSVVGELQLLADGGNDEKRVRARYGLDIISALQGLKELDVEILQDGATASEGVDNRLIKLAKERSALICTADYNLNKVAKVEGISVLNINELAQSVRASYLPGEKLMLDLVQKGNEKKQAIGHLPDGTMVVVENGEQMIGAVVEVEFIRMLQTAAGKMMFAKLSGAKSPKTEKPKTIGRRPAQSKPTKQSTTTTKRTSKPNTKKSSNPDRSQETKEVKEPAKRQPRSNSRRRKTPEDSMVALANK